MLPPAIAKVRRRGGRVIVIDPRFGRWVQTDDLRVALRPGTDGVLFLAVLDEIRRQGLIDVDYVDARTSGFDEAMRSAARWPVEVAAATCDVPADTIREIARLIGTAERCMVLHARGPEQQTMGTANVLAMTNVALAVGLPGRPGCGIDMLTGQRNGQGGREWGQRCNQLPAGRSITDPAHRITVASRWGVAAEALPGAGATYMEILDKAGRGEIKGLLSISNNMSISAPDLDRVDEQMAGLEHVVVIDPFLSEAATMHATVVLPGSTFAEEEGTTTTIEGRVVRCDQAVVPVARRADIDVIRNLARRLGARRQFDFYRGREVFDEMRRVSAGGPNDYAGITWERARDGVFWPCPHETHPGSPQLYTDRFAHPDGRARFAAVEHVPPPIVIDDAYPLVLTTGRHLAQYLSGNQTKRIAALRAAAPGPYIELHPTTAVTLGIDIDDRVVVSSRQGRSVVPWRPNEALRTDTVSMPYHWRECNVLVAADVDPVSKIPGFKYTPVAVEPLRTTAAMVAAATAAVSRRVGSGQGDGEAGAAEG